MATTARESSASVATPFVNEALTDFSKEENIRAQEEALRKLAASFGKTYPLIIAGERRSTG
ncbi:MAG: L-glutamate gamma-semialdehyde dehydrogenase, partial [Ktedonobacterales bacterium]